MRNIQIVKIKHHWPASSYSVRLHNVLVSTDLGLRDEYLGSVVKIGSKWDARVHVHFASGRDAHARFNGFRTMRDAMAALRTRVSLLVAEHFAHQVNNAYDLAYDELEAHEVALALLQGELLADREAPAVLVGKFTEHGLVVPIATLRALLGPNEDLAKGLKEKANYLKHSPLLLLENVREFAYTHRMIEHELIRRAELEEQFASAEL
jgi:hypothetical protein